MKRIKPTDNEHQWPRTAITSIETRKRDLVIRIADWRRIKDASGYDVEVYIGGVYDWNESEGCLSKAAAVKFAQDKIAALL